jgi:SPP1 family predicted phage head-tail adaptor
MGLTVSELNKKIVIQKPVSVSDGMGGFTETWQEVSTVWAAIWPISASETIKTMQVGMNITHRIRIRYIESLRASYRILWQGRYFNITSIINPNTENRWLDILCKEAQ